MTKSARRDVFNREAWRDVWTPPHGTDKRMLRQRARSRLKRLLLRLLLGREEW